MVTLRLTHSPARALAESDRRVSEGNQSRSFCRSLRAHTYSAERTVIPSRRNGRPGRMGSKRPNTPREIRLHPAASPSNRLNLLVTRLSTYASTVSIIYLVSTEWLGEASGICIRGFGKLFSAFLPLTTTGRAYDLDAGASTLQASVAGRCRTHRAMDTPPANKHFAAD